MPGLSWKHFLRDLKRGEIEQVCPVVADGNDSIALAEAPPFETEMGKHERPESAEPKPADEERFAAQSWVSLEESVNPALALLREFADVFPEKIPAVLPADRGVRHEIDLSPGAKYCVTRQ